MSYRVIAACVTHIPGPTANGRALLTFYRDAVLPDGVPADLIKHLLDSGLIEAVGEDAAPADPDPAGDAGGATAGGEQQPPADPARPNARSPKPDLVAYAVTQGMTLDDATLMTREQLLDRYVRQQPADPAE